MRITELINEDTRRGFLKKFGAGAAAAAGLGKASAAVDPLGDFINKVDKPQPEADPLGNLINKKLSDKEKEDLINLFSSDTPGQQKPQPGAQAHPVSKGNVQGRPLPPKQTPPKPQSNARPYNQAPNSVPWEQIKSYLATKMDEPHYVGMMLNMAAESGFRPWVVVVDSNGLPSGGLFQHNGNRLEKLQQTLGSGWKHDWKGQINFALREPKGQEFLATRFNNPRDASRWWTVNFEVPGDRYNVATKRARSPDLQRFASNP